MTRRAASLAQAPPPRTARLTRPLAMRTESYVYGVETLNGHDAWALFEACDAGDVPRIETLLARDPRLVNAQFWYQLPLHFAVRSGHERAVAFLLERGADPGQSRYTYHSWDKLLQQAQERGQTRVAALLERAMRRRFHYDPGFTRLQEVIISRDGRRIHSVLRRRPELVHAADALGNGALHWSVLTRQWRLMRQFVELGSAIDAPRADGRTPVLLAVHGSDYWHRETRGREHPSLRNAAVLVGSLLALGARYTIAVAAAVGDLERVEQILRQDRAAARRLDSGRTSPLAHAAREGHRHIVQALLDHGADPNQPEECAPQGAALWWACCRNHQEIAELLLRRGADPNAGVDSCECCLTIAGVYHGARARPLERLLRRHGAYFPPYRMTARQLARAIRTNAPAVRHEEFLENVLRQNNGRLLELYLDSDPTATKQMAGSVDYPRAPALIRKLLARGLDPRQTDWSGRTFLHACAEAGDRAAAAVFLEAGGDLAAREREYRGTPLASAVRCCPPDPTTAEGRHHRQMIDDLLDQGAPTNLPDDEPWATPLAWATRLGLTDVADLLRRRGAH